MVKQVKAEQEKPDEKFNDSAYGSFNSDRRLDCDSIGKKREMAEGDFSKTEISALIQKVRHSDQDAFSVLLKKFQPLILSLVNKYSRDISDTDREEMLCEAAVGLYNAVLGYDSEQDEVDFGLYAKICMKNRLATSFRSIKRRERLCIVPLDSTREDSEMFFCLDSNTQDDPATRIIEHENFEILRNRISEILSPYENDIWWMYISGMSIKEISGVVNGIASVTDKIGYSDESDEADKMSGGSEVNKNGRTERSVNNALYRIRNKLRKSLS